MHIIIESICYTSENNIAILHVNYTLQLKIINRKYNGITGVHTHAQIQVLKF